MSTQPIAVTGATGEVGGRVARLLAGRGVRQILVVRDAGRAPQLDGAEVREVPGGYADRDAMTAALRGARTLFLIPAHEALGRVEQHGAAVDAAVAAGVEQVVYLSFVAAAPETTFTFGRHHWATEEHIRAAGIAWTFPRMNLYMDFIPAFAGDDGVIRGPAGEGRVAAILRDDVAAACAEILTAPDEHRARSYDLTGPSAVSLGEIADLLGARYVDETEEEAYSSRASHGAPDWEVEGWVTSYLAIRSGELATVSDDVRRLTGRDPVGLHEFLGTTR
jgi:uncharacterized protein YbjT (DUF2867 family)